MHARGHLRVSRFARRTTEKRETARSLQFGVKIRRGPGPPPRPLPWIHHCYMYSKGSVKLKRACTFN